MSKTNLKFIRNETDERILCLRDFQTDFEIHFLEFPWKIICNYSYLILKLLENAKRTVIQLNLLWYNLFVHYEPKLLYFLSDSVSKFVFKMLMKKRNLGYS